jgi:hypothetical protein
MTPAIHKLIVALRSSARRNAAHQFAHLDGIVLILAFPWPTFDCRGRMSGMHGVAALIVAGLLVLQASSARVVPADCAMVKTVEATFSAMPVVRPETRHYTLRVVPVPSCKP